MMITTGRLPIRSLLAPFLALGLGCIIYIAARPVSLLMFQWFGAFGLLDGVFLLRECLQPVVSRLGDFLVFSAPLALWVYSFCLVTRVIWRDDSGRTPRMWFWSLPTVAVFSEIAQGCHIVPGTFDPFDLIGIFVASLLALKTS